jgi:2-polyprenyl-3-methyl-5-hydroxy-6-metoxy-1,4-benzoquinol methylase
MQSPLVAGASAHLIESLEADLIIGAYESIGIDVRRFLEGKHISIFQCEASGFRFYNGQNIFGDSDFYGDLFAKIPGYYHEKRWEYPLALRMVNPSSKLLEIGAGSGVFLQAAKSRGATVSGLELSEKALEVCLKKGFDVFGELIESFSLKNAGQFDIVCSFQVLEHVENPGSFLSSAIECLKPGGKLIIAVPNSNPYFFKYDRYHALNLPPHHAGLWDQKTLSRLPEFFPVKLVSIRCSPVTEYKRWFKAQVAHLKMQGSMWGHLAALVPRPIYKLATRLFSPFIEGQYLLACFQKI